MRTIWRTCCQQSRWDVWKKMPKVLIARSWKTVKKKAFAFATNRYAIRLLKFYQLPLSCRPCGYLRWYDEEWTSDEKSWVLQERWHIPAVESSRTFKCKYVHIFLCGLVRPNHLYISLEQECPLQFIMVLRISFFCIRKKNGMKKWKASSTTSLSVHLSMRSMISCASLIFFAS